MTSTNLNRLEQTDIDIYLSLYSHAKDNMFDDKLYAIMNDNSLTEDEQIDQIYKLQEVVSVEGIGKIISYIGNIISKILHKIITPIRGRTKLKAIVNRYNKIRKEYELYKSDPEKNKGEEARLRTKVHGLRMEINEYREFMAYPAPQFRPRTGEEMSAQYSDPSQPKPQTTRVGSSVGELTTAIEAASTLVWRKYWKERCGKFQGKDLSRCKAKGADQAMRLVRAKLYTCDKTADPEGCKQTLKNLIKTWEERKREYLR